MEMSNTELESCFSPFRKDLENLSGLELGLLYIWTLEANIFEMKFPLRVLASFKFRTSSQRVFLQFVL